jgi:hypothetical protein
MAESVDAPQRTRLYRKLTPRQQAPKTNHALNQLHLNARLRLGRCEVFPLELHRQGAEESCLASYVADLFRRICQRVKDYR